LDAELEQRRLAAAAAAEGKVKPGACFNPGSATAEDAASKKEAANNFFADAEGKVKLVVAKTERGSTLVKTGRASCTATYVDNGIIEISDGEDSIKKQLASLVVVEEKKEEYVDIITVSD
jgi:hypothetical protein